MELNQLLSILSLIVGIVNLMRALFDYKMRKEDLQAFVQRNSWGLLFGIICILVGITFWRLDSNARNLDLLVIEQRNRLEKQENSIKEQNRQVSLKIATISSQENRIATLESENKLKDQQIASTQATNTAQANAIAKTGAGTIGKWEIIPSSYQQYDDKDSNWKIVRIPLSIENRTNLFASAQIPTIGSRLIVAQTPANGTPSTTYPVQLFQTNGSSTVSVTAIDFASAGPIPPNFRIAGVYENDAVSSYFFQARIPMTATPVSLLIPGYIGQFSLPEPSARSFPDSIHSSKLLGEAFRTPSKATLIVNAINIMRLPEDSFNRMAHDRINVALTLTGTNSLSDSEVNLRVTAVNDKGILGAPLDDEAIGCSKPPFTVGQSMTITRTLCAILPYQSTGVRVILTGDVHEIYVPGF